MICEKNSQTYYNYNAHCYTKVLIDVNGNITSKTETYGYQTMNTAYTYDSTGRVTQESVTSNNDDDFVITYGYDAAGNRTSKNNVTYNYDSNNRLISAVTTSSQVNYTYDNNGNQTKKETYRLSDGAATLTNTETFTYNGLNQLTAYNKSNSDNTNTVSAQYNYMSNGYRLSKSVSTTSRIGTITNNVKYIWDNDNIVSFLDSDNNITKEFYRGYNLICDDSNEYFMHDIHGNVIETYTSNSTSPYDRLYYNAYGTQDYFNDTDYVETVKMGGYCDQLYDSETGNYYMRARYYNPETGRFISEDPIKDGMNWYSYCGGNPVMYWDPFGLSNDVAVRTTVEAQGGTVIWNGSKKTITVNVNGKITVLKEHKDYYISQSNNKNLRGKAYMDQDQLFKKCGLTGAYANAFTSNASASIGVNASKSTTAKSVKNSTSIGTNASAEASLAKFGYNSKSTNVETNLVTANAGASINAVPPSAGVESGASLVTISGSKTITFGTVDITISGKVNIGGFGASFGIGSNTQKGVTMGVGGSIGFDINW